MCIWQKLILLKNLNRKPMFSLFPLEIECQKQLLVTSLWQCFLSTGSCKLFYGFGAKCKQTKILKLNPKAELFPKFVSGIWILVYTLLGKCYAYQGRYEV